jgi:hypothetical protein
MGRTSRTGRLPRPIVARLPAAVSHPRRLEASPPGPPQAAAGYPRNFHHLTLVVLAMTWAAGDSAPERFEMARGIVALCRPKRTRAGRTVQGFQKALARLPMRPLVALAAAVRGRFLALMGEAPVRDGFIPLGCDGSRLECPRDDDLLARMGRAGKAGAAPSL